MDQVIFVEMEGKIGIMIDGQPIIKHTKRGYDWKEPSDKDADWELALFDSPEDAKDYIKQLQVKVQEYVELYDRKALHKHSNKTCKKVIEQTVCDNNYNVMIINLLYTALKKEFGLIET